jgi:hypothetical protein
MIANIALQNHLATPAVMGAFVNLVDLPDDRNSPNAIIAPKNPGLPRRGFSLASSPAALAAVYPSATASRAPTVRAAS